jgi:threonine dehydratase
MAGVALAVQTLSPRTRIVGVEPELYDDARRSLASGRRETAAPTVRTLCDSLETPSTGELTFPILRERLSAIVTVSDAEVAEALRLAFSTLKLVVEPGGAVGLAALMAGRVPGIPPGACVGLVLSGGNVDPDLFGRVLRGEF